jgi:hypothetical protein
MEMQKQAQAHSVHIVKMQDEIDLLEGRIVLEKETTKRAEWARNDMQKQQLELHARSAPCYHTHLELVPCFVLQGFNPIDSGKLSCIAGGL